MNNNLVRTGLYYVALAGLFAVPFLAFVVSNSLFFPYITGKNFGFRIIVEIVTAIWLVLMITGKEYWPKRNLILYAVVAFVVVMGLATYFSDNPYKSFWSNFERMEGYVTLLHLLFYFITLTCLLKTEKLWQWFLTANIGASLLIGAYGFLQLGGKIQIMQGGVRVDSTLGNAGYLGTYMFFLFFLTVYLWLRAKAGDSYLKLLAGLGIFASTYLVGKTLMIATAAKSFDRPVLILIVLGLIYAGLAIWSFFIKNEKWRQAAIFAPALILQFVILWETATRGALLGFGGALVIIGLILAIWGGKTYRKAAGGLLLTLLILGGLFLALKNTNFVQNNPTLSRFAAISLSENTTKSRFIIWNMAWEGFKERPILGWGQENFSVVFNKFYSPQMYAQEPWFDRSHNVFMDWLVAGGALGLITYLFIFGALIYLVIVLPRDRMPIEAKAVFLGLVGGYLFQNLFIFDNLTSYLLFFGVLGYIAHRGSDKSVELSGAEKTVGLIKDASTDITVTLMIAVVVAIPAGFLINYVNLRPIGAGQELIKALNYSNQLGGAKAPLADQIATSASGAFKNLIAKNTFANGEAREQYLTLAATVATAQTVSTEVKSQVVLAALTEFPNQFNWNPHDARGFLLFGHYLTAFSQFPQAGASLAKAAELSPNKQSIIFEQAVLALSSNKPNEAVALAKKAFDLEPKFDEARSVYAYVLYLTKQDAAADKLLIDRYGTKAVDDQRLISIFTERKDYPTLITIYESKLKDQPDVVQSYLSLAVVYTSAGQLPKALTILDQGLKKHPEWKAIIDDFSARIKSGEVKL